MPAVNRTSRVLHEPPIKTAIGGARRGRTFPRKIHAENPRSGEERNAGKSGLAPACTRQSESANRLINYWQDEPSDARQREYRYSISQTSHRAISCSHAIVIEIGKDLLNRRKIFVIAKINVNIPGYCYVSTI